MSDISQLSAAFLAGGAAGLSVDILLYPLDTIKTRIQSEFGFWKSGGFRSIYSGIGSVAVGSVPTASMFFLTYESFKILTLRIGVADKYMSVMHMLGACFGEMTACLIRVPIEVVKQRSQAKSTSSINILTNVVKHEGFKGFYRGYFTTVLRDMPFSVIQFPLWEFLKKLYSQKTNEPIKGWQSAICGALSGGISAFITTPLDVAKTRIMLAEKNHLLSKSGLIYALQLIYAEKSIKGLFAGGASRIVWISFGGAIFLGIYDQAMITLKKL